MSLYHGFDMKYRNLRESWKQIQEDEYNDALRNRGTKVYPEPTDEFGEKPGLEGPFRMHNGKTYYYDSKEGKYYDSTTDMYVNNNSDEFYQLTGMKESINENESVNYYEKIINAYHDLLDTLTVLEDSKKPEIQQLVGFLGDSVSSLQDFFTEAGIDPDDERFV